MKRSIVLFGFFLAVFAPLAGAYEYPLQFTPNPGYRGLVVVGYRFEGNQVVGNCSYYTVSGNSGGGKGGGSFATIKNYLQTCRWDLFGNLISITPGPSTPPDQIPGPLYQAGTATVYAVDANGDTTGVDTRLQGHGGFVNTPGTHYTWLTAQSNAVFHQLAYTLVTTVQSDGDGPLNITQIVPSALKGAVTLTNTTCIGAIEAGNTCTITVTYDPTQLTSTTGLAYDTFRIDLTSDAGDAHDFVQNFTIVLPQKLN